MCNISDCLINCLKSSPYFMPKTDLLPNVSVSHASLSFQYGLTGFMFPTKNDQHYKFGLNCGVRAESLPEGHGSYSYLQYILIDGVPEIQKCFFIKLLPVNDAHLLEECRLSAFPGPEKKDLHQPADGSPFPCEHRVYFPAPATRLPLLRRVPLPAPLLAAARVPTGLGREQAAAQGADHSRHVESWEKFTETSVGKCSL